jgi:hypothetical protein
MVLWFVMSDIGTRSYSLAFAKEYLKFKSQWFVCNCSGEWLATEGQGSCLSMPLLSTLYKFWFMVLLYLCSVFLDKYQDVLSGLHYPATSFSLFRISGTCDPTLSFKYAIDKMSRLSYFLNKLLWGSEFTQTDLVIMLCSESTICCYLMM